MVYLDYAAATPVDSDVLDTMRPFYAERFYNPSATYLASQEASADLERARSRVAEVLGAKPREIIFTAGGTEANNLAIQGVMRGHREGCRKSGNPCPGCFSNCSVAVSAIEHDSVLKTAQRFNCSVALVTEQGRVDLDDLRQKISDQTILASVMYANNEVGTLQAIRQIATLITEVKAERSKKGNDLPLYLHTDACQAANYLDLHVSRLGVDMMTLNGGKIYGPKQSGVLYVANHVRLEPLIYGGGQERGLRSGTENVAQAVGFAAALTKAQKLRATEFVRLQELQDEAYEYLERELPEVAINGSQKHRLPNNLHVTFPGQDNERLMMQLERAGFLVAVGSACSASNEEPSHVLKAMGLSDADAQSSLRITMGRQTTQENMQSLLKSLSQLAKS